MIELHLPAPLSVNRTRRLNKAALGEIARWEAEADRLYLWQKRDIGMMNSVEPPYEVYIVLNKACRLDGDNGVKILLDTAVRFGLLPDDGPKYVRRIVVEYGDAEYGSRLIIRPFKVG